MCKLCAQKTSNELTVTHINGWHCGNHEVNWINTQKPINTFTYIFWVWGHVNHVFQSNIKFKLTFGKDVEQCNQLYYKMYKITKLFGTTVSSFFFLWTTSLTDLLFYLLCPFCMGWECNHIKPYNNEHKLMDNMEMLFSLKRFSRVLARQSLSQRYTEVHL